MKISKIIPLYIFLRLISEHRGLSVFSIKCTNGLRQMLQHAGATRAKLLSTANLKIVVHLKSEKRKTNKMRLKSLLRMLYWMRLDLNLSHRPQIAMNPPYYKRRRMWEYLIMQCHNENLDHGRRRYLMMPNHTLNNFWKLRVESLKLDLLFEILLPSWF